MIEILDDLSLLKQRHLDLPTLALAGVVFGSDGASIPRHRITEVTLSPAVSRYEAGKYFDSNDKPMRLDEVVEIVLHATGVVHFAHGISFTVDAGKVVRFTLYGSQLQHFRHITTYEDFEREFGLADKVEREEIDGEIFDVGHYYEASRKWIWWDAIGEISAITLGDLH